MMLRSLAVSRCMKVVAGRTCQQQAYSNYLQLKLYRAYSGTQVVMKKNKRSKQAHHIEKMVDIEHNQVREERRNNREAQKMKDMERKTRNKELKKAGEFPVDHDGDEEDNELELPSVDFVKEKMTKVIQRYEEALRHIRGGEVTSDLFDTVQVEAYGSRTSLTSLAQVVMQSPSRAVVNCFDPSTIANVRDAIRNADMNFNPILEEGVLTVPIPKMSSETRALLVKKVSTLTEDNKKRIRNVRQKSIDKIKKLKELVSKDDAFRRSAEIDDVTKEFIKQLDNISDAKKETIMQV